VLRAYLPALRAHLVIRRRVHPDRADDLLQGFCSDQVLEKDLVPRAERDRGKFRTFLLTALDRYAINCHHHETVRAMFPLSPDDASLDG
jgi:DNA-directed RNA polymerase specialized sigma24 family protein